MEILGLKIEFTSFLLAMHLVWFALTVILVVWSANLSKRLKKGKFNFEKLERKFERLNSEDLEQRGDLREIVDLQKKYHDLQKAHNVLCQQVQELKGQVSANTIFDTGK